MAVKDAPSLVETDESAPSQVDEIVSLIGPKLRALRTAQRHSLQQLAALSDVSAAAIHKAPFWCSNLVFQRRSFSFHKGIARATISV